MSQKYATGAEESPYDIRTFQYIATGVPVSGGKKYEPKDIGDQHKVGICTAIAVTTNAQKALGKKFNADFQYLMQKKRSGNWTEGSSLNVALLVAKDIGFLEEKDWKFTTVNDRKLPYDKYIAKLQKISDADIEVLKTKAAANKIRAFAKVPVDRDLMAQAILESEAGILTRYALGNEWWRQPVEPLRPPKEIISGHAVTDSNYNGDSFRVVNSWGTDWADKGTAYRLHRQYRPTEAWIPYYNILPVVIEKQVESRDKLEGRILDLMQQLIKAYQQLIKK